MENTLLMCKCAYNARGIETACPHLLPMMLNPTRSGELERRRGERSWRKERQEEGKAAGDEICEIKAWVGNHM